MLLRCEGIELPCLCWVKLSLSAEFALRPLHLQ
jgi:hypothetical protein